MVDVGQELGMAIATGKYFKYKVKLLEPLTEIQNEGSTNTMCLPLVMNSSMGCKWREWV